MVGGGEYVEHGEQHPQPWALPWLVCALLRVQLQQHQRRGHHLPLHGQTGIYSNMGEGQRFSCNVMDKTSNGALFNGLAADIDLSGNQFNRHKWGLHLSSSAIIGTQDHKGTAAIRNPHRGIGRGMRTTLTHPTIPSSTIRPISVAVTPSRHRGLPIIGLTQIQAPTTIVPPPTMGRIASSSTRC